MKKLFSTLSKFLKRRPIIFLLVLFFFLIAAFFSIFIFEGKLAKLHTIVSYVTLKSCSELNGKTCTSNASQACENAQWMDASDTNFCCASKCIMNPICSPNLDGRSICTCNINPKKDTIAVLIKQNGELDIPSVTKTIEIYLKEASVHTKKKSLGLKKFTGNTKEDLAKFIKNLYQNEGLGSLVLVGRDLPIFEDLDSVIILSDEFISNLSFIDRNVSIPVGLTTNCKDIAVSYVIPRYYDSEEYSAIDFVKNTFQNFADYHADRNGKRSSFKKEALVLRWDNDIEDSCGWNSSTTSQQSVLPESKILNTQHETFKGMLSRKFAFFDIGVHGSELSQGLGLTGYPDGDKNCSSIYTSLIDLEQYAQNNPGQFLIIGISACGSITIGRQGLTDCCFPQKYLEIGAWSYSALGGSEHDIRRAFNLTLSGETLSDGVRKNLVQTNIFGDILSGL